MSSILAFLLDKLIPYLMKVGIPALIGWFTKNYWNRVKRIKIDRTVSDAVCLLMDIAQEWKKENKDGKLTEQQKADLRNRAIGIVENAGIKLATDKLRELIATEVHKQKKGN